jgi:hypothetical protein
MQSWITICNTLDLCNPHISEQIRARPEVPRLTPMPEAMSQAVLPSIHRREILYGSLVVEGQQRRQTVKYGYVDITTA